MITDHRIKLGSATGNAGTGPREYSATLWVESDDCLDTGHAVLEYLVTNGFKYGAIWEFGNDSNNKSRLYQIETPQLVEGSNFVWTVGLKYKEFKLLVPYSTEEVDPEDFTPEITVRTVGRNEAIEEGKYRGGLKTPWAVDETRLITNSSNVPFSPAVEATRYNRSVTVVRRTAAVTVSESAFPTFWINDVDFTFKNDFIEVPVKKYELLFTGWTFDQEQYEGYDLVRVEFSGEIKKGGWRESLLDLGFQSEDSIKKLPDGSQVLRQDGKGGDLDSSLDPDGIFGKRHIRDRDGLPVGDPVLLDGNGDPLPPGSTDRFYGIWSLYDEIDPTTLGFFSSITTKP